jgi:hypothetical protein
MGNLFDELRRVFPQVEPRTCKKIGHLTRAAAETQLASIVSSPDCIDADALRVYRCANCQQFHVGHSKEAAKEIAREPVRDVNGIDIAPAQNAIGERPMGPWDHNGEEGEGS